MKVTCVLGSPRRWGNTAFLTEVIAETAEEKGAEVETFVLNKLNFKGCQACMSCKGKSEKCVVKDDMGPVLDSVLESDVLVLASPVYFGDITSQAKAFVDRSFSFLVPEYAKKETPSRLAPGKKMVIVLAQGQPDDSLFADIFPRYEAFFRWYGFTEVIPVRACGVYDKNDAKDRQDLVEMAKEAGLRIMGA
ncbi:flavodoxin family protein [Desulfatibacillum aliphaticivorans]|uniref:NADPH-dependent FMN reductase n=1 Tax=Desulfatibacillum aliphaticivorans TaxID=218208 RepID=B8FBZ5_DESAL|nr:flavodoxin family protein [Desulfatibacillum aliphaticivorans]ACL05200.1 NADPH-dependent FMN reductase [Desulfatibacillum aliphaticivorans]